MFTAEKSYHIPRIRHMIPRHSLIAIYKSITTPHFYSCDIIYCQLNNEIFYNRIEKMQYNASLAITSAIRKTSQTKIYRELGVAFLKFRRWLRRHCMFYKIKTLQLPNYLYSMIPVIIIITTLKTEIVLKPTIAELMRLNTRFFLMQFLNGISLI